MRAWVAGLVICMVVAPARADDKLHAYEGQLVISPDPAPAGRDELAGYLKANATKDHKYALIKGPPYEINLVGVLARDPGGSVTLVFTELGAKQPLQAIDVRAQQRLVIARTSATIAAGFERGKTYLVELKLKTAVLAKAELELRY